MGKSKILSKQINEQLRLKANASYSIYSNFLNRVIDALDNPLWHNLYRKLNFRVLKRLKDSPRAKKIKGKAAKKVRSGTRR